MKAAVVGAVESDKAEFFEDASQAVMEGLDVIAVSIQDKLKDAVEFVCFG
jgi:hypothetical protein